MVLEVCVAIIAKSTDMEVGWRADFGNVFIKIEMAAKVAPSSRSILPEEQM